jgi:uncharacterized membrane protein
MMLKISLKAITTFATVPPTMLERVRFFKLFQARLALLVKRIQPPADAAVAAVAATVTTSSSINAGRVLVTAIDGAALKKAGTTTTLNSPHESVNACSVSL